MLWCHGLPFDCAERLYQTTFVPSMGCLVNDSSVGQPMVLIDFNDDTALIIVERTWVHVLLQGLSFVQVSLPWVLIEMLGDCHMRVDHSVCNSHCLLAVMVENVFKSVNLIKFLINGLCIQTKLIKHSDILHQIASIPQVTSRLPNGGLSDFIPDCAHSRLDPDHSLQHTLHRLRLRLGDLVWGVWERGLIPLCNVFLNKG